MANPSIVLSSADSDDEATLVKRVLAGEHLAFGILMRRFNRRLYRLARAIVRDSAEAEDVLQESYLSAFRSLGTFRGESSVSTWLSRLVINECLARVRRDKRRQNVVPLSASPSDRELDAAPADEAASPDVLADRAQMRAILERRIDALPESFRAVFIMRSVEELSVEETAECLGIPEETVRSRHFRAKGLLREALAREVDLAERGLFEFAGARCDRIIARVLSVIASDAPATPVI
ncbi:MAG TPA: RNA polymerase sigma factor [Steroidobacteraceae bacterium]|nr:RNA polymerase sigma factor [Steroidobacteraceae bacterium]